MRYGDFRGQRMDGIPREETGPGQFAPFYGKAKCFSRAGRERPEHTYDKDDRCIFCDRLKEKEK